MTGEELVIRAEAAAVNAYAPYSHYLVGASVLTKDGRFFDGVNVENAAYPLGICAERTAIAKAASEGLRPAKLLAAARPHLLRVVGPNCLGLAVPAIGLNATFNKGSANVGNIALLQRAEAAGLLPDGWDLPT